MRGREISKVAVLALILHTSKVSPRDLIPRCEVFILQRLTICHLLKS